MYCRHTKKLTTVQLKSHWSRVLFLSCALSFLHLLFLLPNLLQPFEDKGWIIQTQNTSTQFFVSFRGRIGTISFLQFEFLSMIEVRGVGLISMHIEYVHILRMLLIKTILLVSSPLKIVPLADNTSFNKKIIKILWERNR